MTSDRPSLTIAGENEEENDDGDDNDDDGMTVLPIADVEGE